MEKKKEVCIELSQKIVDAHENGKSKKFISKWFDIPKSTVQSIIEKFKKFNTIQNFTRQERKEKVSPWLARQVMWEISKSPRITGKVLFQNLSTEGIEILRSTLPRTLKKEGLKGYRPRKTPLLTARHVKAQLYFARKYIDKETSFWSSVLWSNETKIEFFSHRDVSFLWRKKKRWSF